MKNLPIKSATIIFATIILAVFAATNYAYAWTWHHT